MFLWHCELYFRLCCRICFVLFYVYDYAQVYTYRALSSIWRPYILVPMISGPMDLFPIWLKSMSLFYQLQIMGSFICLPKSKYSCLAFTKLRSGSLSMVSESIPRRNLPPPACVLETDLYWIMNLQHKSIQKIQQFVFNFINVRKNTFYKGALLGYWCNRITYIYLCLYFFLYLCVIVWKY